MEEEKITSNLTGSQTVTSISTPEESEEDDATIGGLKFWLTMAGYHDNYSVSSSLTDG
jgi:hypothetical protein